MWQWPIILFRRFPTEISLRKVRNSLFLRYPYHLTVRFFVGHLYVFFKRKIKILLFPWPLLGFWASLRVIHMNGLWLWTDVG